MLRVSLVMFMALTACGGGDPQAIDAAGSGSADAAPPSVVAVTPCPGTVAATVTSDNASFVYTPAATTITQGQVVKFTMSSTHNVAPTSMMSDPGLNVGFGAEKCLMFTKTGTFKFKCTPHGFSGTVTVN